MRQAQIAWVDRKLSAPPAAGRERVSDMQNQHGAWTAFQQAAAPPQIMLRIARAELSWEAGCMRGVLFVESTHPFSVDLVIELLSGAPAPVGPGCVCCKTLATFARPHAAELAPLENRSLAFEISLARH